MQFFDYNQPNNLEIENKNSEEIQQDKLQSSSNLFFESMQWDPYYQTEDNSFLENLFNTEGNIFENDSISNINSDILMSNNEIMPIIKEENSQKLPQQLIPSFNQEETMLEKFPSSKKTKTEPQSTTNVQQVPIKIKKSKKEMTPEELEEKKKMQLEKRLIKNRRTAEVSRKRKKVKKLTLEESLQQLSLQSKDLEKQSIEVSCENRVLKAEYFALLSLILNTPALANRFDKISEIVVDQKEKNKNIYHDPTGQMASVYLFNIIYAIHQQWMQMKQPNSQIPNTSFQNVKVN